MAEASPGKRAGAPDGAQGFVLVVDSEPQGLIFTSMLIQRLKYHVCSALGVGNALEIATASAPSLVITELHLKGLSGLDLMERLKQKPVTSAVPVIIMTRELTPDISLQCRQAGAAACLEKPIKVPELYQAIHPLIEPGTRRRDVRIETNLSVIVNDRPLDCVDGECATNLSVNGMYLQTRSSYPLNSRFAVRLLINEEVIEAEARAVHSRPPEEGSSGMWGVGLQFLKTSPGAGEIIRRFINDEIAHGMDPA
jgi:CheY-like chemotaxis protein